MGKNEIRMHSNRTAGSRVYSGRPLGEEVRGRLELNSKDKDNEVYYFLFPKDTMSINSSYFGGMLEESVISLGRNKFQEKYIFIYDDGSELKQSLKENIEEGIEDALKEF